MIKDKTSKEVSLFNFKKALEACKDKGTSGTFKDPLVYIGTYYDTPLVDSAIVAEPILSSEFLEDNSVRLGLTVKPDVEYQKNQVELLDQVLSSLGVGQTFDRNAFKIGLKEAEPTIMNRFLTQNSAFSEVQNYDLDITLYNPVVTRQVFTINKSKYYQYSLTESYTIDKEEVFTHTIHSLFKEKTSDLESFYSSFVKQKLDKRAIVAIMDTIADNNITGLTVQGYKLDSLKDDGIHADFYSIKSPVELLKTTHTYWLRGAEGGVHLRDHSIKNMEVIYSGRNAYTLVLETNSLRLEIFMG